MKNLVLIVVMAIVVCFTAADIAFAEEIYGSWDVNFVDEFAGASDPCAADPNFDIGLLANGWEFATGLTEAKRTGGGKVVISCDNGDVGELYTTDYFSFADAPVEFYVEDVDSDNSSSLLDMFRLIDANGLNQVDVYFRENDGKVILRVTEQGGAVNELYNQAEAAPISSTPDFSVVLTSSTLGFYINGSRIDINGPNTPGYNYLHSFPASAAQSGFKMRLLVRGAGADSSEYFEKVAVLKRPIPNINDTNDVVDVNVLTTVLKTGLDPNDYSGTNWEALATQPHLRHIFDTSSHYNDFLTFLQDEYPLHRFRYPGGQVSLRPPSR